jgi:hypothetical protein
MDALTRTESFTNIAIEDDREALDVFGPSVQFLVAPQPSDEAPCVIKGTIPPAFLYRYIATQESRRSSFFPVMSRCSATRVGRLIGSRLVLGIS